MAIMRVQAAHDHDSGLPEDRAVNTFHFDMPTVTQSNIDTMINTVQSFYVSGTTPIVSFYSVQLAGSMTITAYNLSDPIPRQPVGEEVVAYSTATTALPSEVAYVLSYYAEPVSGIPQRRRRGRLYLGPLGANSYSQSGTGVGRPVVGLRNSVAAASVALRGQLDPTFDWVVFSTVSNPPVAAAVFGGWLDNSFDTQRRRGERATERVEH